jgi:hypothetical protein
VRKTFSNGTGWRQAAKKTSLEKRVGKQESEMASAIIIGFVYVSLNWDLKISVSKV